MSKASRVEAGAWSGEAFATGPIQVAWSVLLAAERSDALAHGAGDAQDVAQQGEAVRATSLELQGSEEEEMAEYERSRYIDVVPEDVFAFVSEPANMATFVPTIEEAEADGGRVHVHGEVRDHDFDDEGWFRVDASHRRLEWGSDEHDYAGWLSVASENEGSRVAVHISAAPFVDGSGAPIGDDDAPGAERYERGLEAALDSLRNLMEGRGGKVEPATTA